MSTLYLSSYQMLHITQGQMFTANFYINLCKQENDTNSYLILKCKPLWFYSEKQIILLFSFSPNVSEGQVDKGCCLGFIRLNVRKFWGLDFIYLFILSF